MRPSIRIAGTGSYLPRRCVPNRELARLVSVRPDWIEERTGIRSRFFASPAETTAGLGVEASRAALKAAERSPRDLDAVIASTLSPDRHFPGIAVDIQARLKCPRVPAIDVNGQCNGFLQGLFFACSAIQAGHFARVLVVSSEIHSRSLVFHHRSRDLCVLFGDGAGAVVVEKSASRARPPAFELHTDGHFANDLAMHRPTAGLREEWPEPHMNKTSVIVHSTRSISEVVQSILARNGSTLADVDFILPHQSNARLIEEIARRLDCPLSKVIVNIERVGNTSSASIPIALDQAVKTKRVRRRDVLVLVSFGAGFSWGAALLTY